MNDQAKKIAASIVGAAQEAGFMTDALSSFEAAAETERALFLQMMTALKVHQQRGNCPDLTHDEIASMFTFVFAKAAEIATDHFNRQPSQPDTAGLFDGKIPLYADERLVSFCKQCDWPVLAAEAFLNREPDGADPLLALFEALKWTFRVSLHLALETIRDFTAAARPDA